MKICHITNGHNSFDARIFYKECRSLAKAGYDVYLVGPDGIFKNVDGIKIRSASSKYQNRFIRLILTAYIVYKKALSLDADIYHFHDAGLIPYGLKLKKKGKKVIFDSHEDYPADISSKKWLPWFLRKYIAYFYQVYEKYASKRFDSIISVTPHVVNRFKTYNSNTYLVTNYPIISDFVQIENNNKRKFLCYVGRISDETKQKNILKAFKGIDEARYLLAGPCEKSYIKTLMKLPQWEKVDYIGEINFIDSKKIFNLSLAGFQLTDYIANCGYKIGTLGNTKIFAYMEAGLPVICTDFILWKEIIDTYNCGVCVNPNNINEIRNAIKYIIEHPDEAIQMGRNARKAVEEKYNWNSQEKELIKCYFSISNKSKC